MDTSWGVDERDGRADLASARARPEDHAARAVPIRQLRASTQENLERETSDLPASSRLSASRLTFQNRRARPAARLARHAGRVRHTPKESPMSSSAKKTVLCLAVLGALGASAAEAQTITPLTHQPPVRVNLPFLLTDGRVMIQATNDKDWYALSPDASGKYVSGTWTKLASFPSSWNYAPDAPASAVLADGRVIIEGGEYNNGQFTLTNFGAIYDPVANSWTQVAPPQGWGQIGDSPSAVLPDGRYLLGRKLDQQVAVLDPATLSWTILSTSGKTDFNSEEGWTLMPDGTILTADVLKAPNSERYLPDQATWISDGSTGVDLHSKTTVSGCLPYPGGCYYPPGEIGPQILRPDGSVLVTGSTNGKKRAHTSLYRPGATPTDPGTWTPGPDFPAGESTGDAAASLLTNGNVLVATSSGNLYEYNGTTLKKTASGAGGAILLQLPSGETLVTASTVKVYNSTGSPKPAWAPTIGSVPTTLARGQSYTVSGTQFNGLSQAAGFGDEFETATNYPLVRITNNATGHVVYARTHDHSSMGVATGSTPVHTHFDVPATAETGASKLQVVANGIASTAVAVTID
jgi:hypothetical protein